MPRVDAAKAIAREWVTTNASHLPGFVGALFHGSVNWLADNAIVPAGSDIDVLIVLDGVLPPHKPGKFRYRGMLLEVSWLSRSEIATPRQILGSSHLAGSFHRPGVILDPGGHLTLMQQAVAREYAQRRWVEARCRHAETKIRHGVALREADPFPEQVAAWLFPTGITTHILLLAGLRNPTVRTRYLATRELLAAYGHLDFHETLLEQLGASRVSRARTEHHLAALAEAFDAAASVIDSPFFFAGDISAPARPVAIAGSRALIARGDHREALFWMAATFGRCQQVFLADAPELYDQYDRGFRALLADLGIVSFDDLRRRRLDVERSLPRVWEVAEAIMEANPGIIPAVTAPAGHP